MEPPAPPFRGYEKMYEDTQAWELSDGEARALKRTRCVVLEKIHGAKCVPLPCPQWVSSRSRSPCSSPLSCRCFSGGQLLHSISDPSYREFEHAVESRRPPAHARRYSLCFLCEEGRVRTAKRHGILPEAEDFFGHKCASSVHL